MKTENNGVEYIYDNGEITLTDIESGESYTLMDKNLGATEVGIDEASYGDLYIFNEAVVPKGYHIPTIEEWNKLLILWCKYRKIDYDDYINLKKKDFKNFQEDLKIPLAGLRNRYDGNVYNQGDYGLYWSSSPNGTYALYLLFYSGGVSPQNSSIRVFGYSVRCFKN